MYYYSRNISLSELSDEVAGITGKDCSIIYGDHYSTYPDPSDDSRFIITIPRGTYRISPEVRHGVLHEALHIKYTDCFNSIAVGNLLSKSGFTTEAEQTVVFEFLNAFEDIRIQAKGEAEFLGARFIFQEGRDYIASKVYEHMIINCQTSKVPEQQLAKARSFLMLNIDLIPGYTSYPGSNGGFYEPEANSKNWLVNSLHNHWWRDKLAPAYTADFKSVTFPKRLFNSIYERLRDTPTTADGYALAIRYFMDYYKSLLPPDLEGALAPKKLEDLLKAIAAGIADGSLTRASAEDIEKMKKKGNSVIGLVRVACGDENITEQKELEEKLGRTGFDHEDPNVTREDIVERANVIWDVASEVYRPLSALLQEIKEWKESGSEKIKLKRGSLDKLQLHRVALDEIDVYRKDIYPDFEDDVAFSVVVDTSGSMFQGSSIRDCLNTSFGLGVGLHKALSIIDRPVEIVDFSSRAKVTVPLGASLSKTHVQTAIARGGEGTSVLAGVELSAKGLTKSLEKVKIMFILTDGAIDPKEVSTIQTICEDGKIRPYFLIINTAASYYNQLLDTNWKGPKVLRDFIHPSQPMLIVPKIQEFVRKLLTKQI